MLSTTAFHAAFELTGAKSKELSARIATVNELNLIQPTADVHTLVEEAVASDLADAAKLDRRLRTIAEERAQSQALGEVRDIAAAQADYALAGWIINNADDLIDKAGTALQPDLDKFVALAKQLPDQIREDKFPVTNSWTPEQHGIWLEVQPLIEKLDRIKLAVSPLYAGLQSDERQVPAYWRQWFGFIEPGDYAASLQVQLEGSARRGGDYGYASSASINRWVALAHLSGRRSLKLSLAGPAMASERLARYVANAAGARKVAV